MIVNGVDTDRLTRAALLLRAMTAPQVTLTLPAPLVAGWLATTGLAAECARWGEHVNGLQVADEVADRLITLEEGTGG